MSEALPRRDDQRISTGSEILDRQLKTGLRAGSLLAIRAPPASQSEGLLYTLIQERPTLFISTLRREDAVRRDLERVANKNVEVKAASIVDEAHMESEMVKELTGGRTLSANLSEQGTPLDKTYELINSIGNQANIIINSVTPLERCDDERVYRTVLNELKQQAMRTEGLGVLHCPTHEDTPCLRETTLSVADIVWTLEHTTQSNGQKYYLSVTKNRGSSVTRDRIELFLDQRVQIDETRNI